MIQVKRFFATFTDSLVNGGYIDIGSAAGIGQSHNSGDFVQCHEPLVTGQKSKKDQKHAKLATVHSLREELQDSFLSIYEKKANCQRRNLHAAIERQRAPFVEKATIVESQKEDAANASLIQASYLHQQKNHEDADNQFNKLCQNIKY